MKDKLYIILTNMGAPVIGTVSKIVLSESGEIRIVDVDNPFYLTKVMANGYRMYHMMSVIPYVQGNQTLTIRGSGLVGYWEATGEIAKLYQQFLKFYQEEGGDVDIISNPDLDEGVEVLSDSGNTAPADGASANSSPASEVSTVEVDDEGNEIRKGLGYKEFLEMIPTERLHKA